MSRARVAIVVSEGEKGTPDERGRSVVEIEGLWVAVARRVATAARKVVAMAVVRHGDDPEHVAYGLEGVAELPINQTGKDVARRALRKL